MAELAADQALAILRMTHESVCKMIGKQLPEAPVIPPGLGAVRNADAVEEVAASLRANPAEECQIACRPSFLKDFLATLKTQNLTSNDLPGYRTGRSPSPTRAFDI